MEDGEVRALLFDLDGVLIDSIDAWHEAVNDVRRDLDLPELPFERLEAVFGQGVEDDVTNLYPGRSVQDIRRRYDEALPRHLDRMKLGPQTLAVLEDLGRRGLRRAIVTNTQDTIARAVLDRKDLLSRVDAVSAPGRGLREKPHPDLLLDALDRLDVSPARARMVGDTEYDADAARAAGVPFLHFDLRRGDSLRERLAPWL